MPRWLKIVLIVASVVAVILVAAGIAGAMALSRAIHDVQQATDEAKVDGEIFGMSATTQGCIEETVRRCGECGSKNLVCAPPQSAFLWACAESAPRDPSFCAGLPPLVDEYVMVRWGRRTCARYGEPDNEMCAIVLATITGFCESAPRAR